jgi:NADPH2:quinone reductase
VTVRAAVIEEPGRPPAVVDREPPDATSEQVPVEVTAAPITPLDLLCASGTSYFGVPVTPYVPGIQGVGTLVPRDRALDDVAAAWQRQASGVAVGRIVLVP